MPPTPSLLEWELEAFSTRTSSDATTRPMIRVTNPGVGLRFEAHEDRGADRGATFCRAAVTAYNRYGSMIPTDSRSINTLTDFSSVPGADGGWVRSFVKAIIPSDYVVPKPAIKFILPLTGSIDTSQPSPHAASALVVVQGPWYALGGLAEEIHAKIATASPSLDQNSGFQEAGADPIIYSGLRKDLPTSYEDYDNTPDRLHGPIGHTFDQSDANPLWVYSSFVLDAPQVKDPAEARINELKEQIESLKLGMEDQQRRGNLERVDQIRYIELPKLEAEVIAQKAAQEGTFAAVQFTRVINPAGVVNAPTLASLPTDTVWVQFLSSRFSPFTTTTENLRLDIGGDGTASIKQGTTTITLSHALNNNSKTEHIVFGLLLTEEVPDLLGRKGQERFYDVLLQPGQNSPGYAAATWNGAPQAGPRYVGRVLAIQRQVNTFSQANVNPQLSSAKKLWDEMFPAKDTDDVLSRIIAVSPPISIDVSTSCLTDTGGQK